MGEHCCYCHAYLNPSFYEDWQIYCSDRCAELMGERYAKEQQQERAAEQQRLAEMKRLEDRKAEEERAKRAAESKRLEEARIAAEKAQALAAEKIALEQEKRQFEEQQRRLAEEKATQPAVVSQCVDSKAEEKATQPAVVSECVDSKFESGIDSFFNIRTPDGKRYKQPIQLGKKLGEGAFGIVYHGKWGVEEVAVKRLHLQQFSENALREFEEEARIMEGLISSYIVLLKGDSLEPHALIMEYMAGGSLFNLLHSQTALPMSTRIQIALDVANGLSILHEYPPHGILHRDLKSQNVLLTEDLRAKLGDFGLSKVRVESSRSQSYVDSSNKSVGTIPWMAPECFGIRPKYSKKSDMFAYGMVLWEIMSRKMPYEEVTDANEIREAVKNGEREEIPQETTNPGVEIPVPLKQVIRFCWFQEVNKRPAARDAIEALGNIAISMPSPSSGSSSSSSGSSGGLPKWFYQ